MRGSGSADGHRPAGRSSAGWAVFTLLGVAGWLAVTVYVAATNPDPSDPTPILRTFAVAGAAFFALVFTVAAWQLRRAAGRVSVQLYRRLATAEISAAAVRAAARQGRRTGHMYLLFGGLTSGLMLTTIGLGEQGPYPLLFTAIAVVVLAWLGYALLALRGAYRGADHLLAPLGLSVAEVPGWTPAGGGRLVGELTYRGSRHGREVRISQRTDLAVTTVTGDFPRRAVSSADTMASLTGQPRKAWRGVTVQAGPAGVTVRREGNGAGRWLLHDLLLAECVARG